MAIYARIDGYCPACGQASLFVRNGQGVADLSDRHVRCINRECPDSEAAHKVLQDPEIHHIVRFDDRGYFNVKHPLRERIDSELLDCRIHEEVGRWCDDGNPADGTWRIKRRDDVLGEEANEWPYLWENL